jgi:archaetidylinositol phosphate synthase
MFEAVLKKGTQSFVNTMARLVQKWLSANTVTNCAFLFGIGSALCIASHYHWVAFFLLLLSGLCDVLDGAVARQTNTANELGAFRDLIADRMVESAVMAGIAWGYPEHAFACLFFMIALLLHFSTFGIAASLFKNLSEKSFHYNKSFVERVDAFMVFGFVILFPQYSTLGLMLLSTVIFVDGVLRFRAIIEKN